MDLHMPFEKLSKLSNVIQHQDRFDCFYMQGKFQKASELKKKKMVNFWNIPLIKKLNKAEIKAGIAI